MKRRSFIQGLLALPLGLPASKLYADIKRADEAKVIDRKGVSVAKELWPGIQKWHGITNTSV
jgi:hypothetical protein